MSKAIIDRVNNSAWLGVRAKMTPVSLTLPDNLSYEQWAEIGPRVAQVKRFTTWALSDWLNHGEQKWGEMYAQAVDATGFEPNYLCIVKSVGAAIDPSRRRESLSFSHHRLVAPLEPDEQTKLLDLAERNQWSRDQLAVAVQQFKKNIEPPSEEPDETETDGQSPEVEQVFYREATEYHGSVVVDPLAEFDVKLVIAKILTILEAASELEVRQVISAIKQRFLPVRKIEAEIR
jgi:hypothetical protein